MQKLIKEINEREQASNKQVKIRFAGKTTMAKEINDMFSKATKEESLTLLENLLGLWWEAYKSPSIMPTVAAKIINLVGFYMRRQVTVYQTDETSISCNLVLPKEFGGKIMPFFNIKGEPEHIREYFNRLFPFSVRVPA